MPKQRVGSPVEAAFFAAGTYLMALLAWGISLFFLIACSVTKKRAVCAPYFKNRAMLYAQPTIK